MKKCLILILSLLLTLSFYGCDSNSDGMTDTEAIDTEAINTKSDAIEYAKSFAKNYIVSELGFKQAYEPDYGVCDATQNSDGSWDVTLRGEMSGYTDEYRSEFETSKFEFSTEVEPDGNYSILSVNRK